MFQCIKYSYKTGKPGKRQIDITSNTVKYYKNMWNTGSSVDIDQIRGIAYGPRTSTFNMIKECIPWLIASIITPDRTYDFEFKTLHGLKRFISILLSINNELNNTMIIPQLEHIDMDKIWMQQHTNSVVLKIFKNPKWNSWLNNRSRKYRIIKSKNRKISYDNDENCCSICMDTYNDTDFVCQLTCDHTFHISCIGQWLERSFTCPLCRCSIS